MADEHGVRRAVVFWERVMVPATECPRIRPEFLEEERHAMGSRWFRQEYLCEFADTEDRVGSDEIISGRLRMR